LPFCHSGAGTDSATASTAEEAVLKLHDGGASAHERELAGQVAIVTGGGRGVGRATCVALAGAGASVACVARTDAELQETARLVERAGGRAVPVVADVRDTDAVGRAVATARGELGPPTLLVNNAGSVAAIGPLWTSDPAAWWLDVETSLRGSFLFARAVLPEMLERRMGRIVNMTSYVVTRPAPYLSAYAGAKTALVSLTDSLAAETAGTGVSVFALAPGTARTELFETMAASPWLPALAGRTDFVDPELGAAAVVVLASGRVDVLSGRFLHALDDFAALERRAAEIERDDLYTLRLRR
jgi:NAD(P)-dependent dehydrogenase (short-subunit alcohol dehydrogenase family)